MLFNHSIRPSEPNHQSYPVGPVGRPCGTYCEPAARATNQQLHICSDKCTHAFMLSCMLPVSHGHPTGLRGAARPASGTDAVPRTYAAGLRQLSVRCFHPAGTCIFHYSCKTIYIIKKRLEIMEFFFKKNSYHSFGYYIYA